MNNDMETDDVKVTPKQYFNNVKGLRNTIIKEDLEKYQVIQNNLMKKAHMLGQTLQLQKLAFISKTLEYEYKLIELGINTFVYKEDLLAYADKITDKSIKIIELKNYPREIPDDVADIVVNLKKEDLFDEFFVIYTDYSDFSTERKKQVDKERDPILFGTFCSVSKDGRRTETLHNRFYYIADWIDEYCDLTLTKMVEEMAKDGKQIKYQLSIPVSLDEVKQSLNELESTDSGSFKRVNIIKKKSFFSKIKLFFTKDKK